MCAPSVPNMGGGIVTQAPSWMPAQEQANLPPAYDPREAIRSGRGIGFDSVVTRLERSNAIKQWAATNPPPAQAAQQPMQQQQLVQTPAPPVPRAQEARAPTGTTAPASAGPTSNQTNLSGGAAGVPTSTLLTKKKSLLGS